MRNAEEENERLNVPGLGADFYDSCMMLGGRTVLLYYPIQEKLVGIVTHFPACSLWDELRNSCSCSFCCLTKGPGAGNVPRDICAFTESTFCCSSDEGMLFDHKIQKAIALRLKLAWCDFFFRNLTGQACLQTVACLHIQQTLSIIHLELCFWPPDECNSYSCFCSVFGLHQLLGEISSSLAA